MIPFDPTQPNVFGAPVIFTERDSTELEALRYNPTLHKLLSHLLYNEYKAFIERSPLKLSPDEFIRHHAYLTGAYSIATNLTRLNMPDLRINSNSGDNT